MKQEQLRPTLEMGIGGVMPVRSAKEACQNNKRGGTGILVRGEKVTTSQAENFDGLKVIKIDGRFIFHAILL